MELAVMKTEEVGLQIDEIVKDCVPYTTNLLPTFAATLKLADGIKKLREIFLKHPGIKETIEAMKDSRLGFLTDRSPKALARQRDDGEGNKMKAYTYEEIAEACIEAMLNGYRITNNEFNVIAGNYYPAKNGKYRKIIDHPDVTNFTFTNTSPAFDADGKYAKVQCFASWVQKGQLVTVGTSERDKGKEDTLVFRVKVNRAMGEDAIIGKALSKLFSRVLMRIEGKVLPEATDLDDVETATNVTQSAKGLKIEGEAEADTGADPYKVKEESPDDPPWEESPEEKADAKADKKKNGKLPLRPAEEEKTEPDPDTKKFLVEANDYKDVLPETVWKKLMTDFQAKDPSEIKSTMRKAFLQTAKTRLDRVNAGK